MHLSKIKYDLQQVLKLVEDWQEKGVDTLERDLMLEKLRQIYSDVRFGALSQEVREVSEDDCQSTDLFPESIDDSTLPLEELPVGLAISLDDVFENLMPESIVSDVIEMPAEESAEPDFESETAEAEIETEANVESEEAEEEAQFAETESEPKSEIESATEDVEEEDEISEDVAEVTVDNTTENVAEEEVPAPAEAEIIDNTIMQSASTEQPSLFGDEIFFTPRTSRRTRIMSLYDDDTRDNSIVATTPSSTTSVKPDEQPNIQPTHLENYEATDKSEENEEFVEVDVDTIIPEDSLPEKSDVEVESKPIEEMAEQGSVTPVIEENAVPEIPAEPYIEPQIEVAIATPAISAVPESEQVLGEVIKSNVKTIADTIKPKDRAAEQIVKGTVDNIGKAVGINDRFLLIRDLFGGSSEEYERVMVQLNNFDNLDDCMIYIAENFDWNPNSDGAKLIMELLERKYI